MMMIMIKIMVIMMIKMIMKVKMVITWPMIFDMLVSLPWNDKLGYKSSPSEAENPIWESLGVTNY